MPEEPWAEVSPGREAHLGRAEPALSFLGFLQVLYFQEQPLSRDPVVVKLKGSGDGDTVLGGWAEGVDLNFPHLSEHSRHLDPCRNEDSHHGGGRGAVLHFSRGWVQQQLPSVQALLVSWLHLEQPGSGLRADVVRDAGTTQGDWGGHVGGGKKQKPAHPAQESVQGGSM